MCDTTKFVASGAHLRAQGDDKKDGKEKERDDGKDDLSENDGNCGAASGEEGGDEAGAEGGEEEEAEDLFCLCQVRDNPDQRYIVRIHAPVRVVVATLGRGRVYAGVR